MAIFGDDEGVKIDTAHAELLKGLVIAHKPTTILELGAGGGKSADAILEGLEYNQQSYDYTLVDNWLDFGYFMPSGLEERYEGKITRIVTANEKDFIFNCQNKYDFIMSDADHNQTDQWFEHVYNNLLNDFGILIYHDINLFDEQAFPNLRTIYEKCKTYGLSHMLFNKNSLPEERCERGLLVIFRNKE